MTFARGERVHFDFDSGLGEKAQPDAQSEEETLPTLSTGFIGDILERPAADHAPIAPSRPSNSSHGFPAPKKRVPRVSAFRRQRAAKSEGAAEPAVRQNQQQPDGEPGGLSSDERWQIDHENRQRLEGMSAAEIEQERSELLSSLSPSLIQRLLGRANIDDGSNERPLDMGNSTVPSTNDAPIETNASSAKKVSFADPDPQTEESTRQEITQQGPTTTAALNDTITSGATTAAPKESDEDSGSIHFPQTPHPPDLDPDHPDFLKNLHDKYFPNLPYDPAALSWMTPIDPADKSSPYHPSHTALNPSELRFDFKGNLLAPSIAREIPTTEGLHHHSEAPEAAGYTIPELAVMSRSAVPAQRCIAYRTLGRLLYRLGRGQFGVERAKQETNGPVKVAQDPNKAEHEQMEEEDVGSAMAGGLWSCVEEGRIIQTLTEEAARDKGHLTAKTYAQEALWNWRRGGGRKRHAV